ncbi:unnamed protein product [Lymnaea stagnalis]|uniref:carbonic anhydrase n=1 Tax=Lymnaea stagnalis TaxID=6523 RepID=A0AAV2IHZ0_LYMST
MTSSQAWKVPVRHVVTLCIGIILWSGSVDADGASWNYNISGYGSPAYWYMNYSNCGGVMQSPIDINTTIVLYDPWLPVFNITEYSKTDNVTMTLTNKGGHTAEVEFSGTPIYLREGGLPDVYKLVQFHFHWGAQDQRGSEHSIDGYHAPMELHLVHQQAHLENDAKFKEHPFAIAVFGFMFKISTEDNPNFEKLLQYFPKISTAGKTMNGTEIETFKVRDLLPSDEKLYFYRYSGSLTTPECYETVIWSLATQYITISERQINVFRSLYNENHDPLVDDFRPIQALNQRSILTNDIKFMVTAASFNSGQQWTFHKMTHFISFILVFYLFMLY